MPSLDVVYPIKLAGLELRYSLRCLQNVPHKKVWIVGEVPTWTKNVLTIKNRFDGTKYKKSGSNIKKVCQKEELSEDFILMNDDFYILKPIEEVKLYHKGELELDGRNLYHAGGFRTLELLKSLGIRKPLNYEMHLPCVINKKLKNELSAKYSHPQGYWLRTLYFNYYGLGGEYKEDVKIYHYKSKVTCDTFASSLNQSNLELIRFPDWIAEKCRYEV